MWNRLLKRKVRHRTKLLAGEIRSRHERDLEFKAILGERERVAAELHDTVQQGLVAAALQIEAVGLSLPKAIADDCPHLALAHQYLERSREDLRRSVWNLHDAPLGSQDLVTELMALIEGMGSSKVKISLRTEGTSYPLQERSNHEIVRMAGELISNAVRHSDGTGIIISVTYEPHQLTLEVSDNGCGFDPATVSGPSSGHFGLAGLRERADRIAARLTLQSKSGVGTRAILQLPCHSPL